MSSNSRKKQNNETSSDINVEQWLMIEAKAKLADAYNKLNIDASKINGKHLTGYSMEDLNNEKKKVKNELKYYD